MSDPIRKPDEFPSRSESILSDTIGLEGYSIETPPRSRIETLLIELKEIIGQGGGGSSTAYATSLEITMDEYFVMSATLKNKDGDTLGQVQTVDLPLESVVVNGSYDSINKNVVLTLENGNTISFSVADLVSGLQTEITSNNKLDADLVDDSTATHKFATAAQLAQIQINKTALDNKADKSTTYTKTEVDTALSAKANSADVYSKTEVDTALSNKADKSTTYTKTEVDTSLSNKADKSTTYTKTEVDTSLGSKQNTIDVNSKLSADLVDDTNTAHKFATAAQLSQITTNKNNILLLTENGGGLNILDIQNPVTHVKTSYTPLSNGGVELSCSAPDSAWTNYNIADIPCITGKTYKVYIYIDEVSADPVAFRVYLRQNDSSGANYIDQRITKTGCISYTITAATNKFWAGIYLNNSDTARTVTTKMRMMIVQSDTDVPYQPYAMSNTELTAKEQTNENNISTLDKEADALANNVRKNMINLFSFPIVAGNVTITQDLLTGELVFNGTASGTGYIYAYVGTIMIEAEKVYGFIDPMRGKTIDGTLLYSYIGSQSLFSEEYPGFFNSRANRTAIADGKSSIVVRLSGGTTYSDCRLSPMIFDGEITDSTYQPPAETNAHLTQQLQYAQFRRITTNSSSVTFNLIRTDSTNRFRYGFVLLGDKTNPPAIYAMLIGNENANPTVSFTKIGGGIEVTLTGSVVYDGYSVAVTITSTSTLYGGIRLIWLD